MGREIHPVHTVMTEKPFVERIQMLHWNLHDVDLPTILFYVVGDADRLAAALASIPEIRTFDVTPIDDSRCYCYTQGRTTDVERTLYEAFTREGLLVLPPLTYEDDGGVTFDAVGRPDLFRAALKDVPEEIDVTVEQVSEYTAGRDSEPVGLSPRQRQAVEAARDLGYYHVPREATIEDVASELGCAKSTAAEHLQKAENRLVEAVV
ncbi:helix-turn-helix domain-containing protein [Halobellus ordinarius]|uniref:helix-turn-helix domain-containing protein n=1 Tax=Halobellus ordinarius TaxID=3075120 RepID=UPI0028806909|nr:helix-turn-helix domain-containing protein [Halobellus sp. ZY16]